MEKQATAKSQKAATSEESGIGEAPYSADFHARHSNGFEFQFTVRTATEDELVTRLDQLIARLVDSGYEPAARGYKFKPAAADQASGGPGNSAHEETLPPAPLFEGFGQGEEEPLFPEPVATEDQITKCPQCGSGVWDNRHDPNRKPRAPLVKCKNPNCDWRLWPEREAR